MEDLLPELTVLLVMLGASGGLRGDGLLLVGDGHLLFLDATGETAYLLLVAGKQMLIVVYNMGNDGIRRDIVSVTSAYRGGKTLIFR